jgi:ABC-2 type transport system permease protein
MNWRSLRSLIRATWATWLQARSFFFLLAFGWMIAPLVYLFVWSTAAADQPLNGLTRGEFVAYYLILIVVNQLTYAQVNWTVGDLIRYGGLNPLLLRPVTPFSDTLATELAGKGVYLLFVIPVTALLALILRPSFEVTWVGVIAFIPSLLMAWLLRFLWGYWLAVLAFWATRADGLLALQDSLTFLLGGLVAPFVILPEVMQTAARLLPFRYMIGFPVELLTNQLDHTALLQGFMMQALWLAIALGLSVVLWHKGLERYTAVGG